MKTPISLISLFLLCAFTSHLPSATADTVFDIDGKPVINGGTYWVLPVKRGTGGGIELAETGKETCPISVVQSPLEVSNGSPLIISSPFEISSINEGLILNITFSAVPPCAPVPSQWNIVKGAIKLTGYKNTVPGWFKIEKASIEFNFYKFVFCASGDSTCRDIGTDKNKHLVVTKKGPLLVTFKIPNAPENNVIFV